MINFFIKKIEGFGKFLILLYSFYFIINTILVDYLHISYSEYNSKTTETQHRRSNFLLLVTLLNIL